MAHHHREDTGTLTATPFNAPLLLLIYSPDRLRYGGSVKGHGVCPTHFTQRADLHSVDWLNQGEKNI